MIVGFCGYSTYTKKQGDEKILLDLLEKQIGNTASEFFLGGYGNFDHFAYQCAKKFKELLPLFPSQTQAEQ